MISLFSSLVAPFRRGNSSMGSFGFAGPSRSGASASAGREAYVRAAWMPQYVTVPAQTALATWAHRNESVLSVGALLEIWRQERIDD